ILVLQSGEGRSLAVPVFPPAFAAGPFEVCMTPDQRFTRRVQAAIVLFVLLFAYFLAADLWMPITPQAQLTRPVLRIAPRVDGQVLEVAVANNQHVEAGQLLFRLDPEPF